MCVCVCIYIYIYTYDIKKTKCSVHNEWLEYEELADFEKCYNEMLFAEGLHLKQDYFKFS